MTEIPEAATDWVEKLHLLVDGCAAPIERANAGRLACRVGCSDCCVDELTVFTIEAAVIRRHHAALLATGAAHPVGGCAFLDAEGACRIYEHRPYVCRTQGLPLRWLSEDEDAPLDDPAVVESRDICPKNVDGGPPLEELAADDCWTLGPFETRLAERQAQLDGGRGERVSLRSLFAETTGSADRAQNVSGAPEDPARAARRRLPVIE